mmetsp:Transcript_84784/g.258865  ORF Transcript_84784/g.258865 Transcript_84784/m.258865 type:complete len:243 (-) Transcript_84784:310-1038(-)
MLSWMPMGRRRCRVGARGVLRLELVLSQEARLRVASDFAVALALGVLRPGHVEARHVIREFLLQIRRALQRLLYLALWLALEAREHDAGADEALVLLLERDHRVAETLEHLLVLQGLPSVICPRGKERLLNFHVAHPRIQQPFERAPQHAILAEVKWCNACDASDTLPQFAELVPTLGHRRQPWRERQVPVQLVLLKRARSLPAALRVVALRVVRAREGPHLPLQAGLVALPYVKSAIIVDL